MIDHIYLPVSDLNRSSEFYKKVLEPLGIDMPYKFDRLLGVAINSDPGFWLKNGEVAKDLYVAFTAKSADAVRASYKAAIDAGATSNQTRNRAFGPNGVPTTSRQTSATRTDTTSRLPISLGSTNKRYEPSAHLRPAAIIRPLAFPLRTGLRKPRYAARLCSVVSWSTLTCLAG